MAQHERHGLEKLEESDISAAEFDHLESAKPKTRLDEWVDHVGRYVSWLFLVGVVISFLEVVMRYAFSAPTIWAHETTIMLVAVCFAYSGCYAMARDSHIRIGIIYNAVGPRGRRYLDILNAVLTLVFLLGIGYAAIAFTEKSWFAPTGELRLEGSGTAWNPVFPPLVKLVLLLCVALMAVQSVLHLLKAIKNKNGGTI